jgi:hypothetical protein
VREAVVAAFAAEGFKLIQSDPAAHVVDNEDNLPDGDDWYGAIISGHTENDWVTVYVDDWKDSGLLARWISETLQTQAIEVWVANDVNWGYTYWENGRVRDRFADDPKTLSVDPAEAAMYTGDPAALGPVLEVTDDAFAKVLAEAKSRAGQFAGPSIGDLSEALALPFEQAFTAYEYFFTDDPDDYTTDLPHWPDFRHLAFRHPHGRERLAE